VRAYSYDLVIDLQGLLKSGVLTGLSRGKRKIGLSGAREGGSIFLNERSIAVDYDKHAIDRYLRVAEFLHCRFTKWSGRIPISGFDRSRISEILQKRLVPNRPLVAINPMARWTTKLWDSERFANVADKIHEELSCDVVLTGSEKDKSVVEDISRRMRTRPINLAGFTNLKELAYLYSQCRALISTDTGPMHVAAAMGCRVIALFGPTAPWRTGPYGRQHRVIRSELDCAPCFSRKCEHVTCMKRIAEDDVYEAVKQILKS
jgi:3-deoxy-D-manno-octulosonic-acid transferase/heptosyltransferase-1